jgi:hypothetical protein
MVKGRLIEVPHYRKCANSCTAGGKNNNARISGRVDVFGPASAVPESGRRALLHRKLRVNLCHIQFQ